MKHKIRTILFSSVILILFCVFCGWEKEQCSAPMPEPSVWGGYYEDAFVLKLSAPSNGKIYYTTDGSAPTADSFLYTEDGILLQNRSQEPNVYTTVQNVVEDWKAFTPKSDPVEKGTVIRAIYVNSLGFQSDILTQTYFVGVQPPQQGYTLSLVFEYDDMFGESGIGVTGSEYDAWYLSGETTEDKPIPNFEKRLEIPVIAELMDDSGDIMNQAVGLRLQGASARREPKKRFLLVSREEYSGSQVFDRMLYEGVTTHSVMLKRYLPDAIMSDLVSDRSVAAQDSIPVRVFLNGEFWYDSYMLERYDTQYFRQHYQVEDRILVKNGVIEDETVSASESAYYNEYLYWVDNTDFSDDSQWQQFQTETDVQSYIDYLVINYYFCNIDFSDNHNYVLWRSSSYGDTKYEDKRWRWCIYDIDALEWIKNEPARGDAAEINVFSNDLSLDINDTILFRSLRRSPAFCQQFVLSFMDMVNNNFTPANVERVLNKYGHTLDWQDGYFVERPAYAVRHLAEEFDLSGSLETVTVSCSNPEMGSVTVNTSQIDLSSGTWSGQYFTDYPISITAIPKDGYQFLGWKGDANEANHTVTVSVDGGISLEAVFAKEK